MKIKESELRQLIHESIKKYLSESYNDVIISKKAIDDKYPYVVYGEDMGIGGEGKMASPYFAANYLRKIFRRFQRLSKAKEFAEELYKAEVERRRTDRSGVVIPDEIRDELENGKKI